MVQTTAELEAAGVRPLTDPERGRLAECEGIIRKGLSTFLEVGQALAEIHDAMLYRETHKEFKRYCKDVWDLGQSRAYQQMDGYRAVKFLEDKSSTMVELLSAEKEDDPLCFVTNDEEILNIDPNTLEPRQALDGGTDSIKPCEIVLPANERQVRPLTQLEPDDQVKAWAMVLEQLNTGQKLTAALVGKAAKKIKGDTFKRKRKAKEAELEVTARLSNLMRRQLKELTNTINEERNSKWKSSSRTETVKWLKDLIALASEDV